MSGVVGVLGYGEAAPAPPAMTRSNGSFRVRHNPSLIRTATNHPWLGNSNPKPNCQVSNNIPFEELVLGSIIGTGAYKTVHKGKWKGRAGEKLVAVMQAIMSVAE